MRNTVVASCLVALAALCGGSAHALLIDDFTTASRAHSVDSQRLLTVVDSTWEQDEAVGDVLGGGRRIAVDRMNGATNGNIDAWSTGGSPGPASYGTFNMQSQITGRAWLGYGAYSTNGSAMGLDLLSTPQNINFAYRTDTAPRALTTRLTLMDDVGTEMWAVKALPGSLAFTPSLWGMGDFAMVDPTDPAFNWANVSGVNVRFDSLGTGNYGMDWDVDFVRTQAVPEPASMALLGLACAGMGASLKRRRKKQ